MAQLSEVFGDSKHMRMKKHMEAIERTKQVRHAEAYRAGLLKRQQKLKYENFRERVRQKGLEKFAEQKAEEQLHGYTPSNIRGGCILLVLFVLIILLAVFSVASAKGNSAIPF